MNVDAEFWMIIISSVAAVVPWAFSIHAKVAVIANSVEHLPELVEELHRTLQEHEHRLDIHEQEIKTLQVKANPGH